MRADSGRGRVLAASVISTVLLTTVALLTTACAGSGDPVVASRAESGPPPTFAAAAPLVEARPAGALPFSELADASWLSGVSEATGIPRRALEAYSAATIVSNRENPECAAGWNTLAGIGSAESAHGTVFGGAVEADGFAGPEIFGVPLDGDGVAEITDSDAGAIDGDATVDRAVGPMQFIPDTWRNWHVDADRDGVESPHDIDDAALAAVHYLCRAGGDLSSEAGWGAALIAWNRSEAYLLDVAAAADRYADEAASVTSTG